MAPPLLTLTTVVMVTIAMAHGHCGFWYPTLEADQQVTSLNADNFRNAVNSGKTLVVHFTLPQTDDKMARQMDKIYQQMLETTVQSMSGQNVGVAVVNMIDNQNLTQEEGVTSAGTVHVYKGGERFVYGGYRSAEALISYLSKLDRPVVSVIDGKLAKKAFDHVQTTKVVGFFQSWPTGPEMTAFEAAARGHYPDIPFFAVFDQVVATSMRFTTPGEIFVRRPFEKVGLVLPQNPATEVDITAFLQTNAAPLLQRVSLTDGPSVWHAHEGSRQVAFVRLNTPEGNALMKVFKDMVKQGTLQTATQKPVMLIDPGDFPTLTSHWEKNFGRDLRLPALGLINVSNNEAVWADLSGFTTLTRAEQVAAVSVWLEAVSQGRVRVDGDQSRTALDNLDALARAAVEAAQAAAEAARAATEAAHQAASRAQAAASAKETSPSSQPAQGDTAKQSQPEPVKQQTKQEL